LIYQNLKTKRKKKRMQRRQLMIILSRSPRRRRGRQRRDQGEGCSQEGGEIEEEGFEERSLQTIN